MFALACARDELFHERRYRVSLRDVLKFGRSEGIISVCLHLHDLVKRIALCRIDDDRHFDMGKDMRDLFVGRAPAVNHVPKIVAPKRMARQAQLRGRIGGIFADCDHREFP